MRPPAHCVGDSRPTDASIRLPRSTAACACSAARAGLCIACGRATDSWCGRCRSRRSTNGLSPTASLESPWPIPGSILISDGTAYFAAGRQSFADGGILLFAVDPASGRQRWVQRLNTVPQTGYYTSTRLEFDNFDLLFREGDGVAMALGLRSRHGCHVGRSLEGVFPIEHQWPGLGHGAARELVLRRRATSHAPPSTGRVVRWSSFATMFCGAAENRQSLYRRDFQLENGEAFDTKWITGWAISDASRNNGIAWPSQRLAERRLGRRRSTCPPIASQPLTRWSWLVMSCSWAGSDGQLCVVSAADGRELATASHPGSRLGWFGRGSMDALMLTTQDGQVVCLGGKQ